jgi:Zn-dependent alcohol dehydrogenase
MHTKAIVAREPTTHPTWGIEEVDIGSPADDEVLVKITATGICHTDILLSSIPTGNPLGIAYPKILGHEGAISLPFLCFAISSSVGGGD